MARRAIAPDSTAHALHNFANDGKPNSGSGVVFGSVQALEDFKDAIMVLHVKTDTIISNPQDTCFVGFLSPDFNAWLKGVAAEFEGVFQQVA
jgi:hypothetical protein